MVVPRQRVTGTGGEPRQSPNIRRANGEMVCFDHSGVKQHLVAYSPRPTILGESQLVVD
jgi:hypothetical protein